MNEIHGRCVITLYFIVIILLSSCSHNNNNPQGTDYSDEALAKVHTMIEGVPQSVIDLDSMEFDSLSPALIIGELDTKHPIDENEFEGLFLAAPVDCITIGDSLYIVDRIQSSIVVADNTGELVEMIGREGQAPGEFIMPLSITKNDRYVFVADVQNRRIQIFDHAFNYIISLPASFSGLGTGMAANDDKLYYAKFGSVNHLIVIHQSKPPFDALESIFPLIVPIDNPRTALNSTTKSANNAGYISIAYRGLPYIFINNTNGKLIRSIRLEGDNINLLLGHRGPPRAETRGGIPIRIILTSLHLSNNNTIIASSGSNLFILGTDADGDYILKRKLKLYDNDGEMIPPFRSMYIKNNFVYIPSEFYGVVYKYSIQN